MNQDYQFTFTVLTPSYNRARCLDRVYQSLEKQSFKDFEWVIVDDGSQDNTAEVVKHLIEKSSFPIKYVWQENQHKKTAVNNGVRNSSGQFVSILDSDDELTPNALADLYEAWQSIPDQKKPSFQGVAGLCIASGKVNVGSPFPSDVFDSDYYTLVYKKKLGGEYFGFTRRAILLRFSYPEINGFVPESLVWGRIGAEYKTRYINKLIRVYHESEDSMGKGEQKNASLRFFIRNSEGWFLNFTELLNTKIDFLIYSPSRLIKTASNYTRAYLHMKSGGVLGYKWAASLTSALPKLVALSFLPVGMILFVRDKYRTRS